MHFVRQLGKQSLPEAELKADKKACRKVGPCGIGRKALYLNSFYIDRMYYVPVSSVKRVFKRVAMSKGGFTGKGLFASIPYLTVVYDTGKEKQCNFKFEEKVDEFLSIFHERFPEIPIHSEAAEKRLKEKERRLAKKAAENLSPEAGKEAVRLENAERFLQAEPALYTELAAAAKARRVNERSNPAYRWVALAIVLLGLLACAFGVYAITIRQGGAVYFLLFGMAAVFLFSGANVLPTKRNNRRYIEKRLEEAEKAMASYLAGCPEFPVPTCYAHPIVLEWMRDIIREGRAEDAGKALEVLKKELKGLDSSVTVEQEEFDRIMAIKPMFLVRDYK